ncbi:MAG: high-potential iron-sulfur protein [Candidatus Tyrphobacter sp.]
MTDRSKDMTRREALTGLIAIPALAGFVASTAGVADAKVSKTLEKYQTHPNDGHRCSGCRFFHAGKTAKADGTCTIVAGSISPDGWCQAYAAK